MSCQNALSLQNPVRLRWVPITRSRCPGRRSRDWTRGVGKCIAWGAEEMAKVSLGTSGRPWSAVLRTRATPLAADNGGSRPYGWEA